MSVYGAALLPRMPSRNDEGYNRGPVYKTPEELCASRTWLEKKASASQSTRIPAAGRHVSNTTLKTVGGVANQ